MKTSVFTKELEGYSRSFRLEASYSPRETQNRRRALIINHTAWREPMHYGCYVVSKQIERLLQDRDFEIAGWVNSLAGFNWLQKTDPELDFDTVVMNGEGTLHSGLEHVYDILLIGKLLAERGKSVHLINSIWDNNPQHFDTILKDFKTVALRDAASQNAVSPVVKGALLVPDLSWTKAIDAGESAPPDGPLGIQDCVVASHYHILRNIASYHSKPFHRMGNAQRVAPLAVQDSLSLEANEKVLGEEDFRAHSRWLSGRFHGTILGLRHRTPVVCISSNKPKIEALLSNLGLEDVLIKAAEHGKPEDLWSRCNRLLDSYPDNWTDRVSEFEESAMRLAAQLFDRIAQ